jgi:DNA processing protein
VPNEIFEKANYGTNKLIKQGAKLITCANDILEEYTHIFSDKIFKNHTPSQFDNNINTKITVDDFCGNIHAGKKPPAPNYLTKSQLLIYNVLSDKPVSVDEISDTSGLMINEVLSAMTELEIYGLATALPGRKYTI